MARGWPVFQKRTASESGLFIEKSTVCRECLLFPKADVQTGENGMKLGSAFGQKRSIALHAPITLMAPKFAYSFLESGDNFVIIRMLSFG